jgi:hypothetical protein
LRVGDGGGRDGAVLVLQLEQFLDFEHHGLLPPGLAGALLRLDRTYVRGLGIDRLEQLGQLLLRSLAPLGTDGRPWRRL